MKKNKDSGIVTKVEKNFIIVKTEDSKIERIKPRKNIEIGDSIDFKYNDIYKGLNKIDYKKNSVALSMVLVIIIASVYFFGQFNTNKIYGVVSLDVNPSIELGIDKNEIVLAINKKNDDSDLILNDNIIGKDINIALSELISNAYDKNIMSKSDPVVISYVPIEKKNKLIYSKKLNSFIKNSENLIIYVVADEQYLEKSNEKNITVGRTYLKDELNQINKTVVNDKNFIRNSVDELNAELSISEDTKIIKIDIIDEIIKTTNDPTNLDNDIDNNLDEGSNDSESIDKPELDNDTDNNDKSIDKPELDNDTDNNDESIDKPELDNDTDNNDESIDKLELDNDTDNIDDDTDNNDENDK